MVTELSQSLAERVRARAAAGGFKKGLEERLQRALRYQKRRRSLPSSERSERDLYYEETLQTYYSERDYAPIFVSPDGGLTDKALRVVDFLREAPTHGMDPQDYWLERIEKALEKSQSLGQRLDQAVGLELYPREERVLLRWLELHPPTAKGEAASEEILTLLLSDAAENPIPRLAGAYQLFLSRQTKMLEYSIELEALMADGYMRFVRDLSSNNLNVLSQAEG